MKTSHLFLRERRHSSSWDGCYAYDVFQSQNFFSFHFFIFPLYFHVPNFYPSFHFLTFLLLPSLRPPCTSSLLHLTLVSNHSPLFFVFIFYPGVPISGARTLFFMFPLLLWRVLPTTLSIYSPSHDLVETSRSSNFIGSFTSL